MRHHDVDIGSCVRRRGFVRFPNEQVLHAYSRCISLVMTISSSMSSVVVMFVLLARLDRRLYQVATVLSMTDGRDVERPPNKRMRMHGASTNISKATETYRFLPGYRRCRGYVPFHRLASQVNLVRSFTRGVESAARPGPDDTPFPRGMQSAQ